MRLISNTKINKQILNQQLIKEANISLIFNLIAKHEPISRAEIAQITPLSPTTVCTLAQELVDNNMVIETGVGTTATTGRKPIMLEINSEGGFVLAIDMLADGFYLSFYDIKCKELLRKKCLYTENKRVAEQIEVSIEASIKELIAEKIISKQKLMGICIGIPALIDTVNNKVLSSTVLPIEIDSDFHEEIKEKYSNIPVFIGNESWFCAYAEKEFGEIKDVSNLAFIDINIGIGAGVIMNNEIYTGSWGMAGEIGHMTIDYKGPKCKCGNRGCLEIMANIPSMLQKIIFAMMSDRETIVKDLVGNNYNKVDINIIRAALDNEDELVSEIVDEAALMLGAGINNIINLFNPQSIVIGGKIVKLGQGFIKRIEAALDGVMLKPNQNRISLRYSNLGENAVTIGAAKFTLDNIFK